MSDHVYHVAEADCLTILWHREHKRPEGLVRAGETACPRCGGPAVYVPSSRAYVHAWMRDHADVPSALAPEVATTDA